MGDTINYEAFDKNGKRIFQYGVTISNLSRSNRISRDTKLASWKRNSKVFTVKANGKKVWKR